MKTLVVGLLVAFALSLAMPAMGEDGETAEPVTMTVHKDPNCGCCGKWMSHMNEAGFETMANHPQRLEELKNNLGIPHELRSCHTAVTPNGFVFEGHVPSHLVQAFLAAPPEGALGLAVPGMPVGSPGMEVGDRFMAYDVLLINKDGSTSVFAHMDSPKTD